MNVTVILGRVLKEPIFKINETEKGVFHVATFVVAVKKMHSGGFSFLRANVFGKLADSVKENLRKGMNVTLSGEIVTSSYDDRETGKRFIQHILKQTGWSLIRMKLIIQSLCLRMHSLCTSQKKIGRKCHLSREKREKIRYVIL